MMKDYKDLISWQKSMQLAEYETETQLYLCERLQFLSQDKLAPALSLCGEVGKMLNTMLRRLQAQNNNSK